MALLVEGTDYEIVGVETAGVVSRIHVRTINTVDAADTLVVDLTAYGIAATGLRSVLGFKQTTDNSVMVQEQPTTTVSSGSVTLTIPAGTDDDMRFYEIVGYATPNPGAAL